MQPVIEAINSVGALVRFLSRYSPDCNPTELVFAEIKGSLKKHHALMHTVDCNWDQNGIKQSKYLL